jgi:hypothetical protein
VGRDEQDEWVKTEETQTITEQVNAWVEETGNAIVSASAPSLETQWWDETMDTKSITISVTIMYRQALHEQPTEREQYPG